MSEERITEYWKFWDYYLSEHINPLNRLLHFVGTALGIVLLAWFIARGAWYYMPLCFICGYGFSWFGHFFIEKNKPASFKYPLWSFMSDYVMMFYMMTGKINRELDRISVNR